ncbi:MAG: hypothetical protein NTV94_15020 [Planctomycetota bacterium]|nr:hypothetical protein [Planctomycetota bacterium]
MIRSTRSRRFQWMASAALLTATIAGQALGQSGSEAAKQPEATQPAADSAIKFPSQTILRFERAPLASFLVDPKDEALKNALSMIPARVSELPMDSHGQFPEQATRWIELALQTVASGSRLAITFDPQNNAGGAMGYGLITESLFADGDKPKQLKEAVDEAITSNGGELPKSSKAFKGMRTTMVPGGRLTFGPRVETKSFDVYFGTVPAQPESVFAELPKPTIAGLSPIVNGTFDFEGLTPLANLAQLGVSQAANGNGMQPPNVVQQLTEAGFIGENALNGQFEFGYTANASRSRITVNNAAAALAKSGNDKASISAADLNVIPADALNASITVASVDVLTNLLGEAKKQSNGEVEAALAKVKEATQVDLETELLASLGGIAGYYTSQSTGGGLLGYVAFLSFKDKAAFTGAHDKLVSFARSQLRAAQPDGARYVRLRTWEEAGVTFHALAAAGLPIPGELTYAVTDRFLIVGLTQQAVVAAAMQAAGKGDKGILSRTDLGIGELTGKNQLLSFGFTDTARRAREGYNLVALAASAVSNAVRSPGNTSRPGRIVPTINELLREVRPSVSVSYRSGDQFIMETWSDRSALVNAASAAGTLLDFAPIVAAAGLGFASKQNANFMTLNPMTDGLLPTLDAGRDGVLRVLQEPRNRFLLAAARTLEGPGAMSSPTALLLQLTAPAR